MLRLLYLVTFTVLAALASTLAISCAPCETPAADEASDDDGCRLRCGDYGSCSERTPYCCRGICQAEACK